MISSFSLVRDCVPVISLRAFDGVRRGTVTAKYSIECRCEGVDGWLDEEPSVADHLISCGVRMVGADDGAAGGHRFSERDAEALACAWRGEDLGGAHVAQDFLVVVEEAEELDLTGVGEGLVLGFQALAFRAVADDAQGGVLVVGDGVEGVEEGVDVLVLDQAHGEEHVVAMPGEGCVTNLFIRCLRERQSEKSTIWNARELHYIRRSVKYP